MTTFFLVYLTGVFFDTADGPSGLFFPETLQLHPIALRFYNFTDQVFLLSFFGLMACQSFTVGLCLSVFLLGFYYIIGWLAYMIGMTNVFHTMCLSYDCLYQNLSKKALRLTIKLSSILLLLEYLKPELVDSFSQPYLKWVQLFGSFYVESLGLLGIALFFSYTFLLTSQIQSSLFIFDNDTKV